MNTFWGGVAEGYQCDPQNFLVFAGAGFTQPRKCGVKHELVQTAPEKVLDLVAAVVGDGAGQRLFGAWHIDQR